MLLSTFRGALVPLLLSWILSLSNGSYCDDYSAELVSIALSEVCPAKYFDKKVGTDSCIGWLESVDVVCGTCTTRLNDKVT